MLGVGHRVVHGGARFAGPTIVTPQVLAELRKLVPLAPLHQPHNLAAIDAVSERLPGVPQVACFDTSFHRGQPAVAEVVPLPREISRAGVQRYGFHGLSYEYIASVLPQVAPEIAGGRVIVAHLGSGASLCAMKNRKSVDSTLGFTALDGLCMGTRPGALDPGVVLYLFQNLGLTAKEVETMLYKKSGLLGISGHQQRHARSARQQRAGRPAGRRLLRLPRGQGDRRARRGARRHRRPRLHRRHRRELRRDPRAGSARPRPGSASSSTPRRTSARGPADLASGQPRVGLGDPDERRTDHRPAHRHVAGTGARPAHRRARHRRSHVDGCDRTAGDNSEDGRRPRPGRDSRPASGRRDQRPRLHSAELRALRRRRVVPGASHGAHQKIWDTLKELFVEERKKGVLDISQIPSSDHRARAGLHRPRERDHRRPADRRAAQARDHAERRLPDGRQRAEDLRLRARSARRRGLHEVSQDAQRRRVRRLHRRRAALPQLAHPHRAARRLRPRPDHRRLPPRRALRRRRG